jgi:anti-sigma regulatory factor (Ser/Thr protein kinase)
MTPTLTLSGNFAQPDLDSLCDELQDLPKWAKGEPARIDLSELQEMEPANLAVLLASLGRLHRRQICNPLQDLEPPQGHDGTACLHPHALNRLLAEGNGHWQEVQGDSPAILGCEPFTGSEGVDRVMRSLFQELSVHTDWPSPSLKAMAGMVLELGENVIQHSRASGGVAVLRICPSEQRVGLAIADHGVGIRESLARNPDFVDIGDDLTAITKAISADTTGEPGTGGGMGLFLARCLVRSNSGSFLVRSGEACREEGESLTDSGQLPRLHGTLVSVQARTDLPFEYDELVAAAMRQQAAAGRALRRAGDLSQD